jgi:SPP1 family phage portal protein
MPRINNILKNGAKSTVTLESFILREVDKFKASPVFADMLRGEDYYCGRHDILHRKRTAIGEGGKVSVVDNLPNNRVVDNQYRKLADQKLNYILGKPVVFRSDNSEYMELMQDIFGSDFHRTIRKIALDAVNCGVGWLFVNYDEDGKLGFKRFKPYEIIPGWADDEKTKLDYAIRFYTAIEVDEKGESEIQKVEFYDKKGIRRYIVNNGRLVPDGKDCKTPYFYCKEEEFCWNNIPLIPFRCNDEEQSLLKSVKTLQDGLNTLMSNFQNSMEEDVRNTILVLKNYDGENLGEFRRNLSTYGAVKVRSIDGCEGGVEALSIQVNSENYKAVIELFKKAIIENGRGYDAKDDRLSGNANQLNIMSMYSDIDLDANSVESSFKSAFNRIVDFVLLHLYNSGIGDFSTEKYEIIFNRDMLISESEVIDNCIKSLQILSFETAVAQHPWVDDVKKELERKKKEKSEVDNEDRKTDGAWNE